MTSYERVNPFATVLPLRTLSHAIEETLVARKSNHARQLGAETGWRAHCARRELAQSNTRKGGKMTGTNEVVFLQYVDNTLFANARIVADLGEAAQFFAMSRYDQMDRIASKYATLTQSQPGRAAP